MKGAPQRWGSSVSDYAENLIIGKLSFFFVFFFFGHAVWNLSSLVGDQTCVPCSGSAES